MRRTLGFSIVMLGLGLVMAGCVGPGERVGMRVGNPSAAPQSKNEHMPAKNSDDLNQSEDRFEYKIAALDAGGRISPTDPTVDILAGLLDKIERKTKNSPQQIMEMTIRTQQILEETGTTMSLLEIMRDLDKSMADNVEDGTFDYSVMATAFLVSVDTK